MDGVTVRKELAELLLEEKILDEERLQAARRYARREGVALVVAITQQARVPEAELAEALHRRLKLPRIDLGATFVEVDAVREVPYDLAEGHCLLPLSIDRTGGRRVLRVAMADPLDAEAIEEMESSTRCRVEVGIAVPSEITPAVQKHYRGVTTKLIHRMPSRAAPAAGEEQVTQPHHRIEDDAPVELRLRALLSALIDKGVLTEEEYVGALKRLLHGESGG
ncbi:MAG: hypothetical protein EXR72_12875 [Myxococcales bacterium]|nr:hypothetical protein [Myxococcales bacterium]